MPDENQKATDKALKGNRVPTADQSPTSIEKPPAPKAFFHPPFVEQMCDSCHDSKFSQKLLYKGKELCFTCHDDFTKGKKVLHYPVESDECLECHEPHQSVNERLLKKTVPAICYTCHDEKEIRGLPQHEGRDKCFECHEVHASNREKLLK